MMEKVFFLFMVLLPLFLNSLQTEGAGFDTSTNEVTIYFKDEKSETISLNSKEIIAAEILRRIERLIPGS